MIKYLHTNLTVLDIEKMKVFYENVFGCVAVREIQHLTGKWVGDITAVKDAEIKYVHLRFPGFENGGPELELVQYVKTINRSAITANTLGFGHIAFTVSDVKRMLDSVIAAGGGSIGQLVTTDVPNRGRLTEVYASDPEGNIIELQSYD